MIHTFYSFTDCSTGCSQVHDNDSPTGRQRRIWSRSKSLTSFLAHQYMHLLKNVHTVHRTQSLKPRAIFITSHFSFSFVKVLVSFGANPQDIDKENTTLPDYLPEDPDSPKADSHSVARIKKDDKKSGWLSSAATFITNSFYW